MPQLQPPWPECWHPQGDGRLKKCHFRSQNSLGEDTEAQGQSALSGDTLASGAGTQTQSLPQTPWPLRGLVWAAGRAQHTGRHVVVPGTHTHGKPSRRNEGSSCGCQGAQGKSPSRADASSRVFVQPAPPIANLFPDTQAGLCGSALVDW